MARKPALARASASQGKKPQSLKPLNPCSTRTVGAEEFNELGLFVVDTTDGHLNGYAPDDPEYAEEAFASGNRQVLYERFFFGPQPIMASIYYDLYNKDDMIARVDELLNRTW